MIPVGLGDQLLLYTDGVSEARDAAGRFFPLAQVTAGALADREAAARGDASRRHLLDTLVLSLTDHVGDRCRDDILLLLVTMRLAAGLFGLVLRVGLVLRAGLVLCGSCR